MIKPFVARFFFLLPACFFGLQILAAPATSAALAASSTSTSTVFTALTALAGHKRASAKTSAVRSSHRKRKDLTKKIVVRQRKERRLSGKMAVAIRRTRETEGRKTAAILHRMTGHKHDGGTEGTGVGGVTGVSASLADGGRGGVNGGLGSFEMRKGHLPWPVDSRTIAIPFGPYKYMRGVIGNNKGITIAAEEDADVQAVADGKVQEVFPNLDAVMVCHGTYFTTYSNVSAITVAKGEEIKEGQVIGSVGMGGQLDLWLSDEKGRMLDPEKWLRR
jgi:septal ring factor EnvC (AmiA/AmiB activator)